MFIPSLKVGYHISGNVRRGTSGYVGLSFARRCATKENETLQ